MNHEPLPGRRERPWCPICHAPAGSDCPDQSRNKRSARRAARTDISQQLAAEAS